MKLNIIPLEKEHIPLIINYWHNSTPEFLTSLGVDLDKIPTTENLEQFLTNQMNLPDDQKQSLALIWCYNNQPIGHCNINDILKNESAYLHLHIWNQSKRQKGIGVYLLQMSLQYFFKKLNLKQIFSQPKTENIAPNRVLEKAGFSFLKTYNTIPGSINFQQDVNLWRIENY